MAKQRPIEIFMPPNVLKAKVGGTLRGLDHAAIERAEQAIETLKEEFGNWIEQDVGRLCTGRDAFEAAPNDRTLGELYRAAHDLKGQGTTLDFPMISRIAASLCKLVDDMETCMDIPVALVDAHVDAIKVIVRDSIRDTTNRIALALAEELEVQVATLTRRRTAAA